tara:strand:- start:40 stop:183 length:144 start_codon:yes stop_codon:yes gene_type:complete
MDKEERRKYYIKHKNKYTKGGKYYKYKPKLVEGGLKINIGKFYICFD